MHVADLDKINFISVKVHTSCCCNYRMANSKGEWVPAPDHWLIPEGYSV